jgi:murein DD-endopeptidase MepM/ murein hydrolase activator NlpD
MTDDTKGKSKEELIADTIGSLLTDRPVRNDRAGAGTFGASRAGGTRSHKGKDYVAELGEPINSPVVGKVTKIGYPYASDLSYRYVQVTDLDGNDHRMFYVSPDPSIEVGSTVGKGDVIGKAQDVAAKHGGGMINHVHYEILDPSKNPIDEDTYNKRKVANTAEGRKGEIAS